MKNMSLFLCALFISPMVMASETKEQSGLDFSSKKKRLVRVVAANGRSIVVPVSYLFGGTEEEARLELQAALQNSPFIDVLRSDRPCINPCCHPTQYCLSVTKRNQRLSPEIVSSLQGMNVSDDSK